MVRFPDVASSSSADPQPSAIPFSIDDILQDEGRNASNEHAQRPRQQSELIEAEEAGASNLPADLSYSRRSEPSALLNPPAHFDLSQFRFYQQQEQQQQQQQQQQHDARESFMSAGGRRSDLQRHQQQQPQLHPPSHPQFNAGEAASSIMLGPSSSFDSHHTSLAMHHRQSVIGCGRDRYKRVSPCGLSSSHWTFFLT